MNFFYEQSDQASTPLELLTKSSYDELIASPSDNTANWLLTSNRSVNTGSHYLIPDTNGNLTKVVVIVPDEISIWSIASLPLKLPAGEYYLANITSVEDKEKLYLGWGLGAYQYTKFKKSRNCARLRLDTDVDHTKLKTKIGSTTLVRDLINTPANEMLPSHLAAAVKTLANEFYADFVEILGDDLLKQNFPLIHAVGRASSDEPRLLKLTWGETSHPLVGIVGKGVCFDSGGLDIKSATGMRWMKKDMGGAAHALGLANYIMANNLPVHLQVLIPAVENAVAGNAFRPGDVIESKAGKTVEIDNTDAEGRLVMADALAELTAQSPDLLIDFSTLTGAARVALALKSLCSLARKTQARMSYTNLRRK